MIYMINIFAILLLELSIPAGCIVTTKFLSLQLILYLFYGMRATDIPLPCTIINGSNTMMFFKFRCLGFFYHFWTFVVLPPIRYLFLFYFWAFVVPFMSIKFVPFFIPIYH